MGDSYTELYEYEYEYEYDESIIIIIIIVVTIIIISWIMEESSNYFSSINII